MFRPVLGLTLLLSGVAFAHPSHDHGEPLAPVVEPVPETLVPEGFAEVLAAIDEQGAAAEKALEEKRIADLFKACDAMTALVAGLAERAPAVSKATDKATHVAVPVMEAAIVKVRSSSLKGSFSSALTSIQAVRAEAKALGEDPKAK